MDDLIRRQDVINIIMGDGIYCDTYDDKVYSAEKIKNIPTVEPTLYGYKIEHLAYIATVMEKEGVTAEYAVRTFDDIERVIKMLIEEVQAKVEEALNG